MKNFIAGNYINQTGYKSFQPSFLNKPWSVENMEVISLLSQADRLIGKLDMYSEYIPNINLFIQMHVAKEATYSNRIEGTQTNIEDAFLDSEDIPLEKKSDWEEVQNYIKAIEHAQILLKKLPFSTRLIKEVHSILLKGVRGKYKQPGEFRTSQNWIGSATLKDAVFIPPIHTEIGNLMGDLEKFVHNDDILLPELLKVALIHYQFETIHPFLDGNGRLGRLLIILYLIYKGVIKKPILYLSDFFEKNRTIYFDNLMQVRNNNNLNQWFKFFLVGLITTAEKEIKTFDNILQLQKDVEQKTQTLGNRAANAILIVNYLYQRPIVNTQIISEITKLSFSTSSRLVKDLEALGILHEITGLQRSKKYSFKDYLALFE